MSGLGAWPTIRKKPNEKTALTEDAGDEELELDVTSETPVPKKKRGWRKGRGKGDDDDGPMPIGRGMWDGMMVDDIDNMSMVGGKTISVPSADPAVRWDWENHMLTYRTTWAFELTYFTLKVVAAVIAMKEVTDYEHVTQWMDYQQSLIFISVVTAMDVLLFIYTWFLHKMDAPYGASEEVRARQAYPTPPMPIGAAFVVLGWSGAALGIIIDLNSDRNGIPQTDYAAQIKASWAMLLVSSVVFSYPEVLGWLKM